MNIAKSSGVVFGILLGLIVVGFLFRLANSNHKMRTEYDERQLVIRGNAYRLAFYTILIYEVAMMVLEIGGITIPVNGYLIHFCGIVLGCMVLASYCIWKDVYWGLNNNRKRYAFVIIGVALINAVPVAASIKGGSFIKDGRLGESGVNLICLIMLGVLGIELLAKHIQDTRAGEEED